MGRAPACYPRRAAESDLTVQGTLKPSGDERGRLPFLLSRLRESSLRACAPGVLACLIACAPESPSTSPPQRPSAPPLASPVESSPPVVTPHPLPPGAPSFILISLDTLRADRLGAYGNPNHLSPNLDRFAAEAVVFENAFSQATETLHSHASLFTSRYPSELGHADAKPQFGTGQAPLLAQILQIYGYHTGAFVGGMHLHPYYEFTLGFDVYESPVTLGSLFHTVPLALKWLDSLPEKEPFFAFVHGYDAHARYLKPTPFGYSTADVGYQGPAAEIIRDPIGVLRVMEGKMFPPGKAGFLKLRELARVPGGARSPAGKEGLARYAASLPEPPPQLTEEDVEQIRRAYDGGVRYLDALFGLFMVDLQKRGLLEKAWVVVVSDHGEELGENGAFNHGYDGEDANTRVPLMFRPPGGLPGGRKVGGLAELDDVMPTLLALSGAPPPAIMRGQMLIPSLEGGGIPERGVAFTEANGAMVTGRGLTGRVTVSGPPTFAFYLSEVTRSLSLDGPILSFSEGTPPQDREALRSALAHRLEARSPPPLPISSPLPNSLARELQVRGYWQP